MQKKPKKHPGGRPVTVGASTVITYRVDKDTVDALEQLSDHWGCNKSEALRRSIKQAAQALPKI